MAQKANNQGYFFGEIPLVVVTDGKGTYQIRNDQTADTEEMGVLDTFTDAQLDTMRARAAAFGYLIIIENTEQSA